MESSRQMEAALAMEGEALVGELQSIHKSIILGEHTELLVALVSQIMGYQPI